MEAELGKRIADELAKPRCGSYCGCWRCKVLNRFIDIVKAEAERVVRDVMPTAREVTQEMIARDIVRAAAAIGDEDLVQLAFVYDDLAAYKA